MLSATLATLRNNTIISVPTRLKESLEKNKKTLDIFRDLKENEKFSRVFLDYPKNFLLM